MQKYDWTGVKAKLVYSVPGYLSSHDANASGIAMLNRIVKEQFNQESLLDNVTIEYQVSNKSVLVGSCQFILILILSHLVF